MCASVCFVTRCFQFSPAVPHITAINPLAPPPPALSLPPSGPGFISTAIIFLALFLLEVRELKIQLDGDAFIFQIQFPDGGQALISSTASGYIAISSKLSRSTFVGQTEELMGSGMSFLALFLGCSLNSPLDAVSFWSLNMDILR